VIPIFESSSQAAIRNDHLATYEESRGTGFALFELPEDSAAGSNSHHVFHTNVQALLRRNFPWDHKAEACEGSETTFQAPVFFSRFQSRSNLYDLPKL
jgi:hypothetical protein